MRRQVKQNQHVSYKAEVKEFYQYLVVASHYYTSIAHINALITINKYGLLTLYINEILQ